MIEFRNNKVDHCSECGCVTATKMEVETYQGRLSEHCNGQRWERITFLCGYVAEWVPNFSCVLTQRKCTHRAAAYEAKKQIEKIQGEIRERELRIRALEREIFG